MRKFLPALLFLPLCSLADHFEVPAMGGVTFSDPTNIRSVTISPEPDLIINDYYTDHGTELGFLAGLGLVYSFDHVSPAPFVYNFGLMSYFVNVGEIDGIEYPAINTGDNGTMDYQFSAQSVVVMFQARMIYTAKPIQPYVFLGLGFAKNRLYDYAEKPFNPAYPETFESKTVTSGAYEFGAGIQHKIPVDPKSHFRYLVSLDYRYLSMGQAELGTMDGQKTREALQVDNLSTEALVLAITTQF